MAKATQDILTSRHADAQLPKDWQDALLVLQANNYFRKKVCGAAASAVRKQADLVYRKWVDKAVERGKDVSLETLAAGTSALVSKHHA